jgi:signal transduction histidine kinase
VLVVEDDAELRESLAELLTAKGHAVVTATDGREALDTMRRQQPDVVILDLMMPGMDGWQFRVEQRRDPHLAETPVVALSASDSPAAAAVDADCYLRKPIDVAALDRAIEDVLIARERQREPARKAQTERLAALGTLAAGVAHEINNPLTYVLMNLDRARRLVAALPPQPELADLNVMLSDALEGVERIRGVTRSIREFSRVDDSVSAPVEVGAAIEAALRLVASDVTQKANLVRALEPTPPVMGSVGRLGQVFLNLIMNAIQALPERGERDNEIRVASRVDGDRVVVEVSDNGVGIPEHIRGRVFEPFFSTKPPGAGAGLGLAISHGIVQAMGGTLEIASEPGQGTTVRVRLPAAKGVVRPTPTRRPPSARARLLLIDDEASLLQALGRALGERHEVVLARGGRAGIDHLAADQGFDAILCDLHMPEVSGKDVHGWLVAHQPAMAARVIFVTGGAFTDEMRAFLDGTSRPVLEKPIDLEQVDQLLSGMVQRA